MRFSLSRFIPSGVLNALRVLRILSMLRFAGLLALWTLVLWFVLPMVLPPEWRQILDMSRMSPRALLLMHLAPPAAFMSVWSLFRRIRHFLSRRLAIRTAAANAASEGEKRKMAEAEQAAELSRRRAHLECRAVAIAALKNPGWYEEMYVSSTFLEQDTPDLQAALQDIFESALMVCEAVAWLPVVIVRNPEYVNDEALRDAVKVAWAQAVQDFELVPSEPDCLFLPSAPDQNEILPVERIFSLFEEQPIPGLVLIGASAPQDFSAGTASGSGFAVAGIVLNRPDLQPADPSSAQDDDRQRDPYTPYWERQRARANGNPEQWGRVPPALQAEFMDMEPGPFAILHRARTETFPKDLRSKARSQKTQSLLKEALMGAALHHAETPDASSGIEIGWVVHNNGSADKDVGKRIVALNSALQGLDCEWDSVAAACDVVAEHGNTGTACGVLMLAEAFICATQLKKTVLMAGFGDECMTISFTRPPEV